MRIVFIINFIYFFFRSIPVEALVEHQGKFSLFTSSMPSLNKNNVENREVGYAFDFDFKYKTDELWQVQLNPFLQVNTTAIDPKGRYLLEPNEFNLQYKKDSKKILFGYHRTSWEGTDVVNPMDFIHPKNYLNPLSPQNRPSAGLFYSDQFQKFGWDFIYIPKQLKSILPSKTSPWWPRDLNLPVFSGDTVLLLPDEIEYEISDEEIVNNALDNNIAIRLQQHFDSVDISLAAFEGSSQTPVLDVPTIELIPIEIYPRSIFQLQSPIVVQPSYYRNRVVAVAFSYVSSGYGIYRLSAQHNQPIGESSVNPGWSDLSVFEYEKSDIFDLYPDLTLILEAIYSKREDFGGLSVLSSLMEKAYLLGFRWPITESFTFLSAIYQEQKNKATFFHNEIKWMHSDYWNSELTADSFQGISESTLGAFSKNNQFSYKMNFLF